MEFKSHLYIFLGVILLSGINDRAEAVQINMLFDVQLDRVYSYDGTPFTDSNIGDTSTMSITFNTDVIATYESIEPWGVGTSRLFTNLADPVIVNSPYSGYIPSNPISNPAINNFSAAGVTANERLSVGNGIWYEDLWFYNQYSQISQSTTDGIDTYRYMFNVHWNMTNYNYSDGDLYFFDEADIFSVLNRSITEDRTFSISQDAYIDYSDGSYFGYDLDGTATLKEYNIVSAVPTPASIYLFILGLIGLAGCRLRRK